MALQVLTAPGIWYDKYNIQAQLSALAVEYGAETLDVTAFGDTTRQVATSGYKTLRLAHEGYFEAGQTPDKVDEIFFGDLGNSNLVHTVSAEGGQDGEACYFTRLMLARYEHGGAVGEVHKFSIEGASNSDPLCRGNVLKNGTETTTGNGPAYNLGAVATGEKLYAVLHVTAASGGSPTLDVTVDSDDAEGFPSASTRITFTQSTDIDAQWATPVDGPITDDWWRADYTIGGSTPSFTFVVAMAIL